MAGGLNAYGFANGDPVNFSDPFGLWPDWLDRIIAKVKSWHEADQAAARAYGLQMDKKYGMKPGTYTFMVNLTVGMSGGLDEVGGAELSAGEIATSFGAKIESQLGKRGWTKDEVNGTIASPDRTVATTDRRYLPDGTRMNDPATAFINKDGSYVVRNNKSGDIVQISNRKDPNWKSPF